MEVEEPESDWVDRETTIGHWCEPTSRDVVLYTKDAPEANGRVPLKGEYRYTLRIPLDAGNWLYVQTSPRGLNQLYSMLTDMMSDEGDDDA